MLRAAILEDEAGEIEKPESELSGSLAEGTNMPHSGFEPLFWP